MHKTGWVNQAKRMGQVIASNLCVVLDDLPEDVEPVPVLLLLVRLDCVHCTPKPGSDENEDQNSSGADTIQIRIDLRAGDSKSHRIWAPSHKAQLNTEGSGSQARRPQGQTEPSRRHR